MPWSIVQIKKKKGRKYQKVIEAVPDTWIKNSFVYWPSHNQITLQREEHSKIDHETWTPYQCTVFVSGCMDFNIADQKVNDFKPTLSDRSDIERQTEKVYNMDDATGLNSTLDSTRQNVPTESSSESGEDMCDPGSIYVNNQTEQYVTIAADPNTSNSNAVAQPSTSNNQTEHIVTIATDPNTSNPLNSNAVPQTFTLQNGKIVAYGTNAEEQASTSTGQSAFINNTGKVLSVDATGNLTYMDVSNIEQESLANVELDESMVQFLNPSNFIPTSTINTIQTDVDSLKVNVSKMQENLKTFMEAQPAVLGRLLKEMEIMKKGMNLVMDTLSSNQTAEATPAPMDEDFTSCEIYKDIGTADELKKFEEFVKDPIGRGQMIRFIKQSIPTASYKDGRSFFTTVFRFLIDVTLLLPYTWKIATASKIAFKVEFPTFVAFVSDLVMKEYGTTMKLPDIEKCFSERMQYKAIDHKRKTERLESGKGERKTSTRAFAVRGQNLKSAQKEENQMPNEQLQPIQNQGDSNQNEA